MENEDQNFNFNFAEVFVKISQNFKSLQVDIQFFALDLNVEEISDLGKWNDEK